MKRLLVVALMAMGLGMGACGGDEKKPDNTPTFTPAADAQAIVGSWGNSETTVEFDSNGNYKWEKIIPCGAPPCPTKAVTGTYSVSNGRAILNPAEGNAESLTIAWSNDQRTISLDGTSLNKK